MSGVVEWIDSQTHGYVRSKLTDAGWVDEFVETGLTDGLKDSQAQWHTKLI